MEIKSVPADVQELVRSGYTVNSVSHCVNELVFNALDAQAEHISIRINLVTFRIQVVDDGQGISEANLRQVGRRHFSNKCRSFEEFDNNFKYFGYKGEALASIAANAWKVSIVSRCRSSPETAASFASLEAKTFRKTIDANGHSEVEETDARPSPGTTLIVEQFLHNLPVRRRSTKHGELNEIQRTLKLLFLVHPNVSFSLRDDSNKNMLLSTTAVPSIEKALRQQFDNLNEEAFKYYSITKGRTIAKILIQLKRHDSNKHQLFFINQQPVACAVLRSTVNEIIRRSNFATDGDSKLKKTDPFIYLVTITSPRSKFSIVGANQIEFKDVDSFIRLLHRLVTKCLQKENCLPAEPKHTLKCVESEKIFQRKFSLEHFAGAHKAGAMKRKQSEDVQLDKEAHFSQKHSSQQAQISNPIAISASGSSIPQQFNYVTDDLNMLDISRVQDVDEAGGLEYNEKLEARTEVGKAYMLKRYLHANRSNAQKSKSLQIKQSNDKVCRQCAHSNQRNDLEGNRKCRRSEIIANDSLALHRKSKYERRNNIREFRKIKSADYFASKPEYSPFTTFPKFPKARGDNIHSNISNFTFGAGFTSPVKSPQRGERKFTRRSSSERKRLLEVARDDIFRSERKREKNSFNQETCERRNFFNDPIYPLDFLAKGEPQAGPSRMNDYAFSKLSKKQQEHRKQRHRECRRDFFRMRASERKSHSGSKTVTSVTICKTRIQRRFISNGCCGRRHHCRSHARKRAYCCRCKPREDRGRMYIDLQKLKRELIEKKILIERQAPGAINHFMDQSIQCNMTKEIPEAVHVISNVLIRPACASGDINNGLNESDDLVISPTPDANVGNVKSFEFVVNEDASMVNEEQDQDMASPHTRSTFDPDISFETILKQINDNLLRNEWKEDQIDRSLLTLPLRGESGTFTEYQKQFLQTETDSLDMYFAKMSLDNIFEVNEGAQVSRQLTEQQFSFFYDANEEGAIEAVRRPFDVPKGFSQGLIPTPHIDETVSSEVIRKFHEAVCESFDDELSSIKWRKHYLRNTDPTIFFRNIYDRRFRIAESKLKLPKISKALVSFSSVKLSKEMFLQLDILGQYDKKFIIAIWPIKQLLVIFDQHAVHERVRYEQLLKEYWNEESGKMNAKTVKNLRVPLSQDTVQQCEKHLDVFRKFAFEWTHLASFQIATIPKCLYNRIMRDSHKRHSELIKNIIMEILNCIDLGHLAAHWIPTTLRDVINSEACRGAIMFGDELTHGDCRRHIADLSKCSLPFVCVHGRPTCTPLIQFVDDEKITNKFNLKRLANCNKMPAKA